MQCRSALPECRYGTKNVSQPSATTNNLRKYTYFFSLKLPSTYHNVAPSTCSSDHNVVLNVCTSATSRLPLKSQWSICTTRFNIKNSTFWPQGYIYMFCVHLCGLNWLVFITETECLLCGTIWILQYNSG